MTQVNYIQHLNAVLRAFREDNRLNPTHISMYLALFQLWNHHRFCQSFHINREEVMKLAKIGSKSTYHRCLKELHQHSYLRYLPSHSPFRGSTIHMLQFPQTPSQPIPTSGQPMAQPSYPAVPNHVQPLVPSNKQIQTIKTMEKTAHPIKENEVMLFFKEKSWPQREAAKFFNHYQAIGWKRSGKTPIENWQACAKNWMLKHQEFSTPTNLPSLPQNTDNLHTVRNKNYGKPL